jgi:hypothetical protein
MSDLPAVPGNDSSAKGFEGFANKEESTGKSIFHAKHSVQSVSTTSPAADNTTFRVNKRKGANTPASFLESIGD